MGYQACVREFGLARGLGLRLGLGWDCGHGRWLKQCAVATRTKCQLGEGGGRNYLFGSRLKHVLDLSSMYGVGQKRSMRCALYVSCNVLD